MSRIDLHTHSTCSDGTNTIAENVALKYNRPVALFSLEMSVTELAQRFVASQARMPGDKLRKGGVASSDWPKVLKACQALEQAPLWIDDSSALDILELRAKARRLHAKEINQGRGGLGLVIVDYIQLMRADPSADSRVEQVRIWTPDKDLAQCVVGDRVVQVDRRSGRVRNRVRRRCNRSGCGSGQRRRARDERRRIDARRIMKRFAALYTALDATTSTGDKLDALITYFHAAPPEDPESAKSPG